MNKRVKASSSRQYISKLYVHTQSSTTETKWLEQRMKRDTERERGSEKHTFWYNICILSFVITPALIENSYFMLNYGNVPPNSTHRNTHTHTLIHTPITQCLFVLFKRNIVYFKLIKHFLVHIVPDETTEHDLKWTKINWIDEIEWKYYSKQMKKKKKTKRRKETRE